MLKNENAFHKYHSDDLYSTGSIRLKDNGEQSHETPWVIILTHTYIFSNVKGVHKTSYLKKGCFEWLWVFVLLYYFRVIFILFSLVTCHWVIIFLDALMVLSITIRHVGLIQQNQPCTFEYSFHCGLEDVRKAVTVIPKIFFFSLFFNWYIFCLA